MLGLIVFRQKARKLSLGLFSLRVRFDLPSGIFLQLYVGELFLLEISDIELVSCMTAASPLDRLHFFVKASATILLVGTQRM